MTSHFKTIISFYLLQFACSPDPVIKAVSVRSPGCQSDSAYSFSAFAINVLVPERLHEGFFNDHVYFKSKNPERASVISSYGSCKERDFLNQKTTTKGYQNGSCPWQVILQSFYAGTTDIDVVGSNENYLGYTFQISVKEALALSVLEHPDGIKRLSQSEPMTLPADPKQRPGYMIFPLDYNGNKLCGARYSKEGHWEWGSDLLLKDPSIVRLSEYPQVYAGSDSVEKLELMNESIPRFWLDPIQTGTTTLEVFVNNLHAQFEIDVN